MRGADIFVLVVGVMMIGLSFALAKTPLQWFVPFSSDLEMKRLSKVVLITFTLVIGFALVARVLSSHS